jgi:hypothetical protein
MHYVTIAKTKLVIIFRKIIAAYSENYMELINTLCGENGEPFNVTGDGRWQVADYVQLSLRFKGVRG